jgi:hypothetical protein
MPLPTHMDHAPGRRRSKHSLFQPFASTPSSTRPPRTGFVNTSSRGSYPPLSFFKVRRHKFGTPELRFCRSMRAAFSRVRSWPGTHARILFESRHKFHHHLAACIIDSASFRAYQPDWCKCTGKTPPSLTHLSIISWPGRVQDQEGRQSISGL